MKKIALFLAVLAAFFLWGSIEATSAEDLVFTNTNIDIYGYGSFLKRGDVITVYDPDGILCGEFVVEVAGQYGFLHVYGDDNTTPDLDEGAVEGDSLAIFVNGFRVKTQKAQNLVWTKDGDQLKCDLD